VAERNTQLPAGIAEFIDPVAAGEPVGCLGQTGDGSYPGTRWSPDTGGVG
jgi:hypothetical protein